MASMMITVDELRFKKTIYSKAAKNLREVIAVVKKASTSLGNDRMFNEARASLKKLSENLERRANVLEALAEALVYSTDTYKSAQTHSVSQISEYKAHKTDFYGKPVHVSGAAASGAAAAAGGVAASAASGSSSGASQTVASSGSSGSAGNVSSGSSSSNVTINNNSASTTAGSGTQAPEAQNAAVQTASSAPSEAANINYSEDNSTINITNNTVINNITENVYVNEVAAEVPETAAETITAAETAAVSAPAPSGVSGAAESSGVSGAVMFGAGVAAAAAAGAAAFGTSKILKKREENNSIDHQIEEARKKLQAIENEQNELKTSLSETEEADQ